MIIRSQDKKHTTTDMNLEIATKEYFPEFGDGDKTVESKIYNSVGLLLGTYSTEEKAIKVLDMIQNAYERHAMFSITYQDGIMQKLEKCQGLDGARELISSVFQMPQDSEV